MPINEYPYTKTEYNSRCEYISYNFIEVQHYRFDFHIIFSSAKCLIKCLFGSSNEYFID